MLLPGRFRSFRAPYLARPHAVLSVSKRHLTRVVDGDGEVGSHKLVIWNSVAPYGKWTIISLEWKKSNPWWYKQILGESFHVIVLSVGTHVLSGMNVGDSSILKANPFWINKESNQKMACGISCCRMAGSSSRRDSTYLEKSGEIGRPRWTGGFLLSIKSQTGPYQRTPR